MPVANENRHKPKKEWKPRNIICIYTDSRRALEVIILYNFEYLYIVLCDYIKKHKVTSF